MNMYQEVETAINGLEVGENKVIDTPDNLPYFRKYLTEISTRESKKFTTKVIGDKLHIFRIKYHNLYSKTVE